MPTYKHVFLQSTGLEEVDKCADTILKACRFTVIMVDEKVTSLTHASSTDLSPRTDKKTGAAKLQMFPTYF